MSYIKSQNQTQLFSSYNSVIFENIQSRVPNCQCSQLFYEIKNKVHEIVSIFKQQKDEFLESVSRQMILIKQENKKSNQEKDEVIEDLKYDLFKLIAVKNQMKRAFDQTLEKKNEQIKLLKQYIQKDSRKVEPYKLLSPKTKQTSISKRCSKQLYSPKQSSHFDSQTKASISPTSPSITSLSRKSSDKKDLPLRSTFTNFKYMKRSENVKSALNLISRVSSNQLKSNFY